MRRLNDWLTTGFVVGLLALSAFLIAIGLHFVERRAAPKVYAETPAKPPEIAVDIDKTFSEFRMRQLGLPSVWYYPERLYPEKYRPVKEE